MKLYILRGTIAGEPVTIKKMFKTREEAVDYMFLYSAKHYVFNLEVEDIVNVHDDKHDLDYICNNSNRFNVRRVVLA